MYFIRAMGDMDVYPLHRAAFFNDIRSIAQLIKSGHSVYEKDMHGNTALHISTMLGHREATAILLAHNAPVKSKNCDGWNSLAEAVSYGDRQTITEMLRKLKSQSRDAVNSRKPHLVEMLQNLDDFYMEVKWEFQSWVPLLSRILPSDICQIYKKGCKLRMDTSLADFNERRFERGDISFLFNAAPRREADSLIIMDNKMKVYQRARLEQAEAEVDEEVDVLMSSDFVVAQVSTKTITFQQAYAGWVFKRSRSELIGNFNVNYYAVDGLKFVSRKRREHLSAEDVKKNKYILRSLAMGSAVADEDYKELQHRKSLPPPGRTPTTWEEYCGAAPGAPPALGRAQIVKCHEKTVKAFVGMSEDFPLSIDVLLDVLEIVSPFKHFEKLRRFCEARLPPGFPVQVEIPLLPTISARVTFQKFTFTNNISDKLFSVPASYREDTTRFPDL